ncbi:MAG TPA: SDR family oxidoreductase [Thermoanaerobaculia bacterium]|nr:SDR family oxidoreductase [Thermoanaerobaculia bacterium]
MNRRTALVTGASSGIGLDLARLFAADGWDVVLVARTESKLREIAAQLGNARVIVSDLSKPGAAKEIVAELERSGTEIEALVNNAGYGLTGPFAETDLQRENEMIQVNIVALTQLTKLLLAPMVARKHGRILNVASTAAFQPGPLMAVYYATKAYVLSFSEAIADELRNSGVTVTTLCPGPTKTGFAEMAKMTESRLFTMMRPMSSADVARAGYHGMLAGRHLVIPGAKNKLLVQSLRISPRRAVIRLVRKFQESR